jgi:hypothetical protein
MFTAENESGQFNTSFLFGGAEGAFGFLSTRLDTQA